MMGKTEDKREIVREIKRMNRSGVPLNFSAMHKAHWSFIDKAIKLFGSWQAAIEAAGLDYAKISKLKRWSKAEILDSLQKLHRQKKIPDVTSLANNYPKLFSACRRHFGTGRLAFEAARLPYDKLMEQHPDRWTKAKIIRRLQERYNAEQSLCRAAILRDEPHEQGLCYSATHHFGTWGAALKAAGLDPDAMRKRDGQWPQEKVLQEIHARHQSGKLLHTDLMARENLPLHAAGRRHFGTWQKAVERAGINYGREVRGGLRGFSPGRTARSLRIRMEKKCCTKAEVEGDSPALFRAALHHFGSWQAALRAAQQDARRGARRRA